LLLWIQIPWGGKGKVGERTITIDSITAWIARAVLGLEPGCYTACFHFPPPSFGNCLIRSPYALSTLDIMRDIRSNVRLLKEVNRRILNDSNSL
jgi:hypothetical protein